MRKDILLVGSGAYGQFIQRACADLPVKLRVVDGREVDFAAAPESYVIIATPNFTHFGLVKAALEAGKHVLCEKPLALSLEEINTLFALAAKKKRYLGVGFVLSNHRFYQTIKKEAGRHKGVKAMYVYNHATEGMLEPAWYWNPKQSGGWFMVAEIHWYHLFAWLTESADLTVAMAKEHQTNHKTHFTHSVVTTPTNQTLMVEHFLNADYATAWTKVEVLFGDRTRAVIDDWVPRSLAMSHGTKRLEKQTRNAVYAGLIQTNIKQLLAGKPLSFDSIYLAHKTALAVEKKQAPNRR